MIEDFTNKKYNRLTGIEYVGSKNGKRYWKWKCDCGNEVIIKATDVKCGYTKSCGCYAKERTQECLRKTNKYDLTGEFGVGYTADDYEFYFDLEDFDTIRDYCWHRHKDGYLRTKIGVYNNGKNHYVMMHRLILGDQCQDSMEIDHINGRPNDNRKENLRIISHNDNMKNIKTYSNNKTGQNGVYYNNREHKYKAEIHVSGQRIHLGTFEDLNDAIMVRRKAEQSYIKEYVRDTKDRENGTR